MIKSLILIFVFLVLLPFLAGLFYTGFVKEDKNSLLLNIAAGYVILFGLFEIVALPLIWMRQSLDMLLYLYGGLLAILCVISLILHGRRIRQVIAETLTEMRRFTLAVWAEFLVILGQIFIYARYQYSNADDSFYVAAATTAEATNTIFAYKPYTGTLYEKLPSRYVLSPFYAFTAVFGRLTDTHPAILAHTVFMILFLLLAYAVYALLGKALFSNQTEKVGYFLLLVSALQIFSAYSEQTSGIFLLIRLWQGKAVLAGILLPMILYMAIRIFLREGTRADWVLLFFLMSACCMVSSMGVMLGAIMLGIFGLLFAWRNKNIRLLFGTILCCIPNLICGMIYLVIH